MKKLIIILLIVLPATLWGQIPQVESLGKDIVNQTVKQTTGTFSFRLKQKIDKSITNLLTRKPKEVRMANREKRRVKRKEKELAKK